MVPAAERLTVPEERRRTVYIGGDATPKRAGAVDWTNKWFHTEDLAPCTPRLRRPFPGCRRTS